MAYDDLTAKLEKQISELLAERDGLRDEAERLRAGIPALPKWLIDAANDLPPGQKGVGMGFAAAGWTAAWAAIRDETK